MPYRKTNPYPFSEDDVVRRLRNKRKEDLVAIICYISSRLELTDNAMKEVIKAVMECPVHPAFFDIFKGIVNGTSEANLHLMKKYTRFVDGLESPTVISFQIREESNEGNCDSCEDEPEYDPSDITVQ